MGLDGSCLLLAAVTPCARPILPPFQPGSGRRYRPVTDIDLQNAGRGSHSRLPCCDLVVKEPDGQRSAWATPLAWRVADSNVRPLGPVSRAAVVPGASHPEILDRSLVALPLQCCLFSFLLVLITKDLLASFGRFLVLQPKRINGLPTAIRRLYS